MALQRHGGWALALALALAPVVASAQPAELSPQDRETARQLIDEGDRLVAAGDLPGALNKYESADRLVGVPSTGIEVGNVRARLGRLIDARDVLLRVARYPQQAGEPEIFTKARAEAAQLAAELGERIPTIRVVVKGLPAGVQAAVAIDGAAVPANARDLPRPIDPGEHQVVASAEPGYAVATARLTVQEREQREVVLEMKRLEEPKDDEPSADEPERGGSRTGLVLTIVGFSVAGAGALVGSVAGARSLSKANEAEELCGTDHAACSAGFEAPKDESIQLANVSNVAFALAGAGVVVGIVGLAIGVGGESADETALIIAPDRIGLAGRF